MQETIILAVIGGVVILYLISVYNRLVTVKHNVDEAWSNIDVLLKQRYEELPKLVDTCKRYMAYESETLTEITRLRNEADAARRQGDAAGLGVIEGGLAAAVGGLLARAEAYPDLKGAEAFQQLMARISVLEESIADRREFFNEAVNINNIRREQFPDLIVARLFGFEARALLKIAEQETQNLDVRQLFAS